MFMRVLQLIQHWWAPRPLNPMVVQYRLLEELERDVVQRRQDPAQREHAQFLAERRELRRLKHRLELHETLDRLDHRMAQVEGAQP